MLEPCVCPGSNAVEAFTKLIGAAFLIRDSRRIEAEIELMTRRRGAWAVHHKHEQEGATPSDGMTT